MDETTFLNMVAQILEADVADVKLADDLDAIGWDSLSNISFIAEVDDVVGVEIDADELAKAETIADLLALTKATSSD